MADRYDDVIREYIAFVNEQSGMYMDALAGFAGHHTKVGRQVHRISKATGKRIENGQPVIVYASYEDPSKPDIVLNRIVRTDDYLASNKPGGSNEQHLARAIVVFLFTFWEDEVRPRLASASNASPNEIRSDIMGDLRILRHAILHARGILKLSEHRRLKVVAEMFPSDQPIFIAYEDMHRLFVLIKQDCARLMYAWLGIKAPPVRPEEVIDLAIQRGGH